jgi:hypothetical protein
MINLKEFTSGGSVTEVLSWHLPGGTEGNTLTTSFKFPDFPTEIRNGCYPN